MKANEKLKYIDLFAGCGGLSLGLYNSGRWQGLFAIEKSFDAFLTLESNLIKKTDHFDWPTWLPQQEHDINLVLKKYKSELTSLRGAVDLVTGGPPCQGFSVAGKRQEDDERNTLIESYVKFIRLTQPKMIFFENVKGFLQKFEKNKTKGKAYSDYILRALQRTGKDYYGYHVFGKLVDFSEYGVPQRRTRFILVGLRKDVSGRNTTRDFFKEIKLNRSKFLASKGFEAKTSVKEAISDLVAQNHHVDCPDSLGFQSSTYKQVTSAYQSYMRRGVTSIVPDSHRLANHNLDTIALLETLIRNEIKGRIPNEEKIKLQIRKRSLAVLDPQEPAPTLTTHPDDFVHYCEPRIPTVREYARIQTFPDTFEFKGRYTTGGGRHCKEVPRYSQIGNAIPPLFSELAGLTLANLLTINE